MMFSYSSSLCNVKSAVFRVGCNVDALVFVLREVNSCSFRVVVFRDGLAAGAIGGRSTGCQQNIRHARSTIGAITCIYSRDVTGNFLARAWHGPGCLSINRRHWSWLARLDVPSSVSSISSSSNFFYIRRSLWLICILYATY